MILVIAGETTHTEDSDANNHDATYNRGSFYTSHAENESIYD